MGANLYINSILEAAKARHQAEWEELWETDDADYPEEEQDERRKRRLVLLDEVYYESGGYFRESYGSGGGLLHFLDLSWWRDVGALLDLREVDETADVDRLFLAMLESKARDLLNLEHARATLERERLENKWVDYTDVTPENLLAYQQSRYEELTSFLRRAIDLGEPVVYSI